MVTFEIATDDPVVGDRLDKMLTAHFDSLSRTKIQQLIKEGLVTVDDKPGKASYRIEGGETIAVEFDPHMFQPQEPEIRAENIPLEVVYEDDVMAAVNKPAGMVVHPAIGHTTGTLVNAIMFRWPEVASVGDHGRAGIVHRLDKDTSGVILVAKTEAARRALMSQFKNREVKKKYIALIEGVLESPTGEINAPIGRHAARRKRMSVVREGRKAITQYHAVQVFTTKNSQYSMLEVFPLTGRTHQIRVHLAFIGHPVVGDKVYGHRKQKRTPPFKLKRHFLHAESLTFTAPATGQSLTVTAPLPAALQDILDELASS